MYHVTEWETGKIRASFGGRTKAARVARAAGHTGEDCSILRGYPPVCYVANDAGEVVYTRALRSPLLTTRRV